MDQIWIWVALIPLSILYLAFAVYQLVTKAQDLKIETQKAQQLIADGLANVESEISPAKANTEEDLVGLIKDRRARSKQKLAQKAKRQRRLVARIHDIEIDKRFL